MQKPRGYALSIKAAIFYYCKTGYLQESQGLLYCFICPKTLSSRSTASNNLPPNIALAFPIVLQDSTLLKLLSAYTMSYLKPLKFWTHGGTHKISIIDLCNIDEKITYLWQMQGLVATAKGTPQLQTCWASSSWSLHKFQKNVKQESKEICILKSAVHYLRSGHLNHIWNVWQFYLRKKHAFHNANTKHLR